MRVLYGNLADQVYDCGDYLLVRKRGVEERVSLSEILEVRKSWITNPPRLTLRLACEKKLGTRIVFIPVVPIALNPPKTRLWRSSSFVCARPAARLRRKARSCESCCW